MADECPHCGHQPQEPSVTVSPRNGGIEVVARRGTHAGWAFSKKGDERWARDKALLRLRAAEEGWFDPYV